VACQTRAAIDFASKNLRPTILSIPHDLAVKKSKTPRSLHLEARGPSSLDPETSSLSPRFVRPPSAHSLFPAAEHGLPMPDGIFGDVARWLGALTATTLLIRGIFPKAHSNLGVAGGFGYEAAVELI
jgi:hypothetical protein